MFPSKKIADMIL